MPGEPIGTRIAKRRHVLGLSQQELAARVGVTRDAVSAWERDRHFPHRHLGKLEEVLGVSLSDGQEPVRPRNDFERDLLSMRSLPDGLDAQDVVRLVRDELARRGRERAG